MNERIKAWGLENSPLARPRPIPSWFFEDAFKYSNGPVIDWPPLVWEGKKEYDEWEKNLSDLNDAQSALEQLIENKDIVGLAVRHVMECVRTLHLSAAEISRYLTKPQWVIDEEARRKVVQQQERQRWEELPKQPTKIVINHPLFGEEK